MYRDLATRTIERLLHIKHCYLCHVSEEKELLERHGGLYRPDDIVCYECHCRRLENERILLGA